MPNDPNELVQTERMRKWPLVATAAAILVIGGVLVYSMHFAGKGSKEEKARPSVITHDDKPLASDSGGMGLATPPPAPVERKKEGQPPIVVVTSSEPPELRREKEDLRRQKHQAAMAALSSPLTVHRGRSDTAGKATVVQAAAREGDGRGSSPPSERLDRPSSVVREGDYDPSADRDKEGFLDRSKATDRQWLSSSVRMAGHPFEVKTGAVIPAAMVGGINSDLPGQLVALVRQNVYDTADGRYLLIPQGSKLYGVYDSRIIYGQSRVLVAWNRIIFPDGSAITLESMPGTDAAGYGGFNDDVDNHYFRIFGNALLMSLITGGTAWAVDSVSPNNGVGSNASPSLQQQLTSALAAQLGQTTAQVLSKGMNVKPTLEIRPGYQFNVVVTKDLVFREPYRDR